MEGRFVPWWWGFKAYWTHWKYLSFIYLKGTIKEAPGMLIPYAPGWSRVIRTPLFMVHIAKRGRSCNRDGYESGIRIHWFPKRWSLRLREAEVMYRHTRE